MWVVILLGALLWPGHGLGILDGIPLDRPLEAIVVGALVPALWWLNPRFMRRGLVRVGIALLILLKVADATLLTQQGWCVRFETPPLYEAGPSVQTSWDARADWRSPSPRCSAIVSRPYWSFTRFPVWFLNLQDTRPPRVPVHATFDGYVRTAERSTLSIDTYGSSDLRPTSVALPDGVSHVRFAGTFVGSEWKFAPLLNGNDVFSAALTTISPPTAIDLVLGRLLPAAITVLAIALIVAWVADAMTSLAPSQPVVWWTIITAVLCAAAGALDFDRLGRLTVLLFVVAVIVPTPQHLRNRRGAFLLFGVPWLALLIAGCIGHAGRITIYSVGDDWTTFQRFAHRIYIQGYWLEGGERGFWQQPLYRWIVGALHVVFGDASIGEMFLDAAALFAGSLFAFEVVRRVAGFSTGVGAGVLTLVTVAFGPNWHVIGRGLSDAVAAGLIYVAALWLIDAGELPMRAAAIAGCAATLAFLTRLNYLPLIVILIGMTMPFAVTTRSVLRPIDIWESFPKRQAVAYFGCITVGVLALMSRTWYYLGTFNLFAGTTRLHNATGLGVSAASFASTVAWRNALESVAMIVTIADPPALNVRAVLVISGVIFAGLALLQVPVLRRLPLALVLLCLGSLAGGIVARGVAYPGRFSLHLIPIATAVCVSAAALLSRLPFWRNRLHFASAVSARGLEEVQHE